MITGHLMLRALGIFGLGGAILLISPQLRATVIDGFEGPGTIIDAPVDSCIRLPSA